jgi:hypothetical protein
MTQGHVKSLEKARDQLLAQRRSLAEALAGGYKKGRRENHIERIVKVQAAIGVITSAINQSTSPHHHLQPRLRRQKTDGDSVPGHKDGGYRPVTAARVTNKLMSTPPPESCKDSSHELVQARRTVRPPAAITMAI